MTRPLPIDLKNGWYHVANRGNNRQAICLDERDREHFWDLLSGMIEGYSAVKAVCNGPCDSDRSWAEVAGAVEKGRGEKREAFAHPHGRGFGQDLLCGAALSGVNIARIGGRSRKDGLCGGSRSHPKV